MVGKTISHYEVLEKLGEGGMGVVYKARDSHLKRFVALKVLPPQMVADAERKQRFVQEARSASALNHPNIVTVYDIDQSDGVDFIAMEYVEGKTLDELIGRKGMRLNETLKYGVQIADALAKAHAAGIVHRDLKPGNVMVTGDGRAKVLDFGLAKLTEASPVSQDGTPQTEQPKTESGLIVGTVSYMSPEQAEGKQVDARSDIFSFGSLLYEMLTGRRAFRRDSPALTLAAILHLEPPPLPAGMPQELERVLARCLRKDPARRFQTMADLKVTLEELKEDSDSGKLAAAGAAPARKARRWLLLTGAAVPLLALTGWLVWRSQSGSLPPPRVVPLTAYAGREWYPFFSPDGNQVAFSWNGEKQDNFDIYVKLVGSGTPLRLTADPAVDDAPTWSPDGRQIAFVRQQGSQANVYLISPLGGPERKLGTLQPAGNHSMSWSPDGKWLAVAELEHKGGNGIFLIPVVRGEERRVTSNSVFFDQCPAFSPDGQFLAYASCRSSYSCDVYLLELGPDFSPKAQSRRLTHQAVYINGIAWTADGRSLLYAAARDAGATPYLWRLPVSRAVEPERLDLAGPGAVHPAIARVGKRLVYSQGGTDTDIMKFETGAPVKSFISSTRGDFNPQYSPAGKQIAFVSNRSGTFEIWVSNLDGSNLVQLTDGLGRYQGTPRWSPDGRWIAFDAQGEDGRWDIYVIDAAGGQPRCLTPYAPDENVPSWSRDGKWIYFTSNRSGNFEIWRISAGGGESVRMTDSGGYVAFESWDGKSLYYTKARGESPLFVRALAGGGEQKVLNSIVARNFVVVEDGIYYIARTDEKSAHMLQFFDFATRRSRLLTIIEGQPAIGLTVSPDRKTVLFTLSRPDNLDLMLVENFR